MTAIWERFRAACDRSGDEALGSKCFHVLFAFNNEDNGGADRILQSIKHLPSMLPIDPSAQSIRIPLKKTFRLGPHNLIEKMAVLR